MAAFSHAPVPSLAVARRDPRRAPRSPTPIALCGLFMALGAPTYELLFSNGDSGVHMNLRPGGILMSLGGFIEQVLGNHLPAVSFLSLGLYCFMLDGVSRPTDLGISADDTLQNLPPFYVLTGLVGSILLAYLFVSLKKNIALATTLFFLNTGAGLVVFTHAAMPQASQDTREFRSRMLAGAGICFLIATVANGWLLLSTLLDSVDFPFRVPVGDFGSGRTLGVRKHGAFAGIHSPVRDD